MTRPGARSPWLAGVLSAVASPGLGQLYNGRLGKFLLVVLGLPIAYAAILLAALRAGATLPGLAITYVLILAGWAWTVADAFRDARRLGGAPRPWFSRWYVLTTAGLATVFVLVPLWTVVLMRSAAPAYKLPTGGMEQTMLVGDHVIVDATAYGFRLPFQVTPSLMRRPAARGDIAVFRYPPNPSQHFVKRVVGLPGETVEIRGQQVLIDGTPIAEPYVQFIGADSDSWLRAWGPETVPAGHYFVLGDNRDNSKDSRYWGFLPESKLIGRVAVVYLSIELSRHGGYGPIRWDRFGHVPR